MQYDSENQKRIVITAIKKFRGLTIEETLKFANTDLNAIVSGKVVPPEPVEKNDENTSDNS